MLSIGLFQKDFNPNSWKCIAAYQIFGKNGVDNITKSVVFVLERNLPV
jgi:hypothetical protein